MKRSVSTALQPSGIHFRATRSLGRIALVLSTLSSVIAWPASAQTYEQALTGGLTWITDRQSPDGSWDTRAAVKSAVVAESVLALQAANERGTAYLAGLTWLQNHAVTNVDALARRTAVLARAGSLSNVDIEHLFGLSQVVDAERAGWGLSANYVPAPLESALGVAAHSASEDSRNVQSTLDFIKSVRLSLPQGGWSLAGAALAEPVVTAQVVRYLLPYVPQDASLGTAIDEAASALAQSVDSASPTMVRAHSALALSLHGGHTAKVDELLDALVADQQPNGSWDNRAHATAMAIQAFAQRLGRAAGAQTTPVAISDARLRRAINLRLGRRALDRINIGELAGLDSLVAPGAGIGSLAGLELASNLTRLDLSNNNITSLAPLSSLSELQEVNLQGNPLSNTEDIDGDGLPDAAELAANANPLNPDTDADGVRDGDDAFPVDDTEVADADGDGVGDNADPDDDNDDLPDTWELANGTGPLSNDRLVDADGDGHVHYLEYVGGSNPMDRRSVPAYEYYVLDPRLDDGTASVTSLVDNNVIAINAGSRSVLDANELGTLAGSDVVRGTRISATGPFSIGAGTNGTDLPGPTLFAGTTFVVPHFRGAHYYYLLSPGTDTTAQIDVGAGFTTVPLPANEVVVYSAGSDNAAPGIIYAEDAIVVGHTSQSGQDNFPVPPATREIFGIRSTVAMVAALEDDTTVLVYASDGSLQTISLAAGEQSLITAGSPTSQGQGSAIRIVADRPVSALQLADGDGIEATAFLDPVFHANRYVVPVDSQYVAIACGPLATTITLNEETSAALTKDCIGDGGEAPGKVYFGSSDNGVHVPAGSVITSEAPVYVTYEAAGVDDEHNLLGVVDAGEHRYYLADSQVGDLSVRSLADGNEVRTGDFSILLDGGAGTTIPASELEPGALIEADAPISLAARAGGTDSPVPVRWAGRSFAIPHARGEHEYIVVSPFADAEIAFDAGDLTRNQTLLKGEWLRFAAGSDSAVSGVVRSDVPVVVSHVGLPDRTDVYAVPPASRVVYGINSRLLHVGAVQNDTAVTVTTSSGQTQTFTLNSGQRKGLSMNGNESQGQGAAVRVVANKPINVIQSADADGNESTAFVPAGDLSTEVVLPIDAQYVAVACERADKFVVMIPPTGAAMTERCDGVGSGPGKAFFGSPSAGVHVVAGSVLRATGPFMAVVEAAPGDDERNLFGEFASSTRDYFVLNRAATLTDLSVASLSDKNVIRVDGVGKWAVDQDEILTLFAGELAVGDSIRTGAAVSLGDRSDASDTPVPLEFAALRHVVIHPRDLQRLYIASPLADALISVDSGTGPVPHTIARGSALTLELGATTNRATSVNANVPVLAFHGGYVGGTGSNDLRPGPPTGLKVEPVPPASVNVSNLAFLGGSTGGPDSRDAYPVPPPALSVVGVRSRRVTVAALDDATSVSVQTSAGTSETFTLDAGRIRIVSVGVSAMQGAGDALRISANKPITAIQWADGDGYDATAFLPSALHATEFAIPVDAQYVVAICDGPAPAKLTLISPAGEREDRTCTPGVGPAKAYFGSTAAGVHVAAGSLLISDEPVYVIYEAQRFGDERNLLGRRSR
ncbi:MAG: leucine-rich repeat domain-containing protein [Gammaproteobacteria bacterium]